MNTMQLVGMIPFFTAMLTGIVILYRVGNNPRGDMLTFILCGVSGTAFMMQWFLLAYFNAYGMKCV